MKPSIQQKQIGPQAFFLFSQQKEESEHGVDELTRKVTLESHKLEVRRFESPAN